MRARFLACLVVTLLAIAPSAARADGDAFRAVIAAQVEAFKRNDWAAAFAYASPGIRAQFGDAETFRRMVMQGYRPVARPRQFEFENATVVDGRPTQPVYVVGPDGTAHRALYFMERQPDGSWLIAGCVLLPLSDQTT